MEASIVNTGSRVILTMLVAMATMLMTSQAERCRRGSRMGSCGSGLANTVNFVCTLYDSGQITNEQIRMMRAAGVKRSYKIKRDVNALHLPALSQRTQRMLGLLLNRRMALSTIPTHFTIRNEPSVYPLKQQVVRTNSTPITIRRLEGAVMKRRDEDMNVATAKNNHNLDMNSFLSKLKQNNDMTLSSATQSKREPRIDMNFSELKQRFETNATPQKRDAQISLAKRDSSEDYDANSLVCRCCFNPCLLTELIEFCPNYVAVP